MNTLSTDLSPSPQISPELAAARARLDRLEDYLLVDPGNEALLTDVFETALRSSEWARAAGHLARAKAQYPDALPWVLREANLALAQEKYPEAATVLNGLALRTDASSDLRNVVLHNLAYIDFAQGDCSACVDRLASHMDAILPTARANNGMQEDLSLWSALSCLWLRALHRTGDVNRVVQWAKAAAELKLLLPQAAGIASLAALDAEDLESARAWVAMGQQAEKGQKISNEAWVTAASLALGAQDAVGAHSLAENALRQNPEDGRAWSVRAFADLLAGQPQASITHFVRATTAMPGHVGTWLGRGWAELVVSDPLAAQQSFQTALNLDRNFAESHGSLAVVLALQKKVDEAGSHVKLAQRLNPENLSGRYAQALLSGELADAKAFERLAQNLLGRRKGLQAGSMFDEVARAAEKLKSGQ